MDPAQFQRFQELGAQYGVMMGGDIEPYAQLQGRLVGYAPQGATAEQMVGRTGEIGRRLQLGSGALTELMQSYVNAMASMVSPEGGGAVSSPEALATLAMGASRGGSPRTVDTTLMQFQRAVQGFVGKPEWQQYLRGIGIQEGMPVERAMEPLFRQMEQVAQVGPMRGSEAEVAAQTRALAEGTTGPGRDLNAYLQERGLTDYASRRAVMVMFSQRQAMESELFGSGLQPRATPESVMGMIAQTYEQRPGRAGFERQAKAARETAGIEVGMEEENAQAYRDLAVARLMANRQIGSQAAASRGMQDLIERGAGFSPDTRLIDETAREIREQQSGMRAERGQPGMASVAGGWWEWTGAAMANAPAALMGGGRSWEELRNQRLGTQEYYESLMGREDPEFAAGHPDGGRHARSRPDGPSVDHGSWRQDANDE
jgi:hypothetical protein